MKPAHTQKKLLIISVIILHAICMLAMPLSALAQEPQSDLNTATEGIEKIPTDTLPIWSVILIVLGFIVVIAIMAHSVIVHIKK
jgi:uncharacterized membrane protein YidH (DUF202 family)